MQQDLSDEEAKKKLIKLNLIGIIVSYKIQTYKPYGKRDNNGVLINNNGIKHNYDFINFAYKYWILPLSTSERDKKIYIKRVESLGLLVELSYDSLEKYFCNNYTYNNSNNDASPVSSQ